MPSGRRETKLFSPREPFLDVGILAVDANRQTTGSYFQGISRTLTLDVPLLLQDTHAKPREHTNGNQVLENPHASCVMAAESSR